VSTDGSRPFYFLAIEFCSRDTDKLWPRSQLADIPANEFPVGTAHIYGLRNSQTGCMEGSNLFDCRYNIATWRRDGIWRAKTWRAFNRVRSFERAQLNLAIRERRALCRQTIFCRDSSSSGEDIARVGFRRSSKTLTGKKQKKRERERERERSGIFPTKKSRDRDIRSTEYSEGSRSPTSISPTLDESEKFPLRFIARMRESRAEDLIRIKGVLADRR